MEIANRLEGVGEYYFSAKLREIDKLNGAGKKVINLGIGSPDLPPHREVIETLDRESSRADVHSYQSYKGSPVLRDSIARWYQVFYSVDLNPETEILPLIGSKEGIMHLCMTFINPGDRVLVPNPGYPTYSSAVRLAGGVTVDYSLTENRNYEPDWAELDKLEENTIRMMFVNYPHMPTGRRPDKKLFEKFVAFARKKNILVVHDNPYSFILNNEPLSMLSVKGSRDVVIELNSLSKSHNMAGWRVGMMLGAGENISSVLRFKSNMDSGMFLPVQLAAARAMTLGKGWYEGLNKIYAVRRELVHQMLELLGCVFSKEQSGLFTWARIPSLMKDSFAFSDEVLNKYSLFITPGGVFGSEGNQHIRVSLCATVEKIGEAIKRIKSS